MKALCGETAYATDILSVLESKDKRITAYYIEERNAKALKILGFKMKSFKWVDNATLCEYCPKPMPASCCDADGKKRRIGYEIWRKK
jgi:hypothetical protein